MDIEAVNDAINATALRGRLTAEDLERWRTVDNAPLSRPPLWLSVLLSFSASIGMHPDEVNTILLATMTKEKNMPERSESKDIIINPMVFLDPCLDADAALKRGDIEAALTLWLRAIEQALNARMTPAEPYRMYGNLASTAFMNGESILGEAALKIALKLNPNYSFGLELEERNRKGEFLPFSISKLADSPPLEIITSKDLETTSTREILATLAGKGINLNEQTFEELARPVKDTIEKVADKVISLSDNAQPDEDYVYAACQVLWDRLVTRPLFETFEDLLYDLDDCEPDSSLYFDLIRKLRWAFDNADNSVFEYYQKYPHELDGLRYTLHDLLAYEVLRTSSAADDVLVAAERALESGYFPDMAVADVVARIANGKNWQHQFEKIIKRYPEHGQVMTMGLARGLLEIGESSKAIGACNLVWNKVLAGELAPKEWEINSIGEYLLDAYLDLGDKSGIKRVEKEINIVEDKLESIQNQEAKNVKTTPESLSYTLLKNQGTHQALFDYEHFLKSLGLNFSTDELTKDQLRSLPLQMGKKTGRNEPCPCGSGKKYKKCHGENI